MTAPLLEDQDGAPYPDDVQQAHRAALLDVFEKAYRAGRWDEAWGRPYDPEPYRGDQS